LAKKANSLIQLALHKFKRNLWGVLSFWYVVICILIAVFAYVIAPDNSAHANQMHLSIHSMPPGFKVRILELPNLKEEKEPVLKKLFFGKQIISENIPITDYVFEGEELKVKLYNREGQQALERNFNLNENFPDFTQAEIEENLFTIRNLF